MCRDRKTSSLSRRRVMAGAGALLAASTLPVVPCRAVDSSEPAPNAIPPSEALDRLKQGNARYVADKQCERDCAARRAERVGSQYPIVAILSCSDSRVPPEIIFDQGPGDVFVVRDAGNVVSTYGLASMEYAIKFLGVPLIVVMGHTGCGAVAAALGASTSRKELPGHLPELVKAIEPAIITAHGKHPGDFLAASIEENVRLGMKRLKTQSEILGAAVASGKLGMAGGVYDLASGKVELI